MSRNSLSLTRAIAIVKSLDEGTRFYASEFNLAGGTISGLVYSGYIRKTGNSKKYMVNVYDNHYIEAEVFEWEVHDCFMEKYSQYPFIANARDSRFNEDAKMILEAAELLKSLGY